MANEFENLYTYNTSNGVVIPQTASIKESVENTISSIFGGTFSVDETTPTGVLVSAIVKLFENVCGVNAQNANGLNMATAVGAFLDALGGMAGIQRGEGESDGSFRARILASASRGSGFAASVANAISNANGLLSNVTGVVVLDNGLAVPNVLPKNSDGSPTSHSITVEPHSLFICVKGGYNSKIAEAIKNTKSAGCGFTTTNFGVTLMEVPITDSETGSIFTAKFYRPKQRYVFIKAEVYDSSYTGTDIVADTKAAIKKVIDDHNMNATLTKGDIISAIASYGKNIVCTKVEIGVNDTSDIAPGIYGEEELVVMPYQYVEGNLNNITVEVK